MSEALTPIAMVVGTAVLYRVTWFLTATRPPVLVSVCCVTATFCAVYGMFRAIV